MGIDLGQVQNPFTAPEVGQWLFPSAQRRFDTDPGAPVKCGKMARPSKYRKEMCQQIIDAMALGLSKEAAAVEIGICKDTLYDWTNPASKRFKKRFSDAVQEGEGQSLLFWEKMGIQGAAGKLKNFKSVAWTFNMVNRHKWTMKQEISGPGGGPIVQKVIVLPDNGRNDRDVDES